MKSLRIPFCFLFAVSAWAAPDARRAIVPTEDFAREPIFSRVQMSPDGKSLAFLAESKGQPTLMFDDRATKQLRSILVGEDPWMGAPQQVDSFQWVGDRRVAFATTIWDYYFGGVSAVDCDGKQFKPLTGTDAQTQVSARALNARTIIYRFEDADQSVLMLDQGVGYGKDLLFPDVVKLNTLDGGYRIVVRNPGNVVGWGVDYAGTVRWGVTRSGKKSGLIYRTRATEPWRNIPATAGHHETIRPLGFDTSGRVLYVAALTPRKLWGIYFLNPITGELGDLVLDDPYYDVAPEEIPQVRATATIVSRVQHQLVGVYYVTDGPRITWLSPLLEAYQDVINQTLPGKLNIIVSETRDERTFLVYSFTDRDPGTYYIFDVGRRSISKIIQRMPWIKPEQMATMYPIKYPARDGRIIHGYMTLPVGAGQKNLPLVVMPHGGPWARDVWSFNPLVQLLANRGYAVLQMNYRGSPGFGEEFSRIAKHEIGRGIQDDIEDGARWAIAHHIADPRRVAIVGISYGGYSALFALGHNPELYRCGVSISGVTDWPALFKKLSGGEYQFARQYWDDHIGDPKNDAAFLESISPVNFADRIKAPVLIIQGKDDKIVPPKQAHAMADALEKAGRPPQTLYISGDGHGLTTEKSRMAGYKAIEEFLAKNMSL